MKSNIGVDIGIIISNDDGKRGTRVEYSLTPNALQQMEAGTLDLSALKKKNKKRLKTTAITRETRFKILYILILLYNKDTTFEFHTKDALQFFLMPFHLGLSFLSDGAFVRSKERIVDPESDLREERHFQTMRVESPEGDVNVFIDEYVNRLHGGSTTIYNCRIRGTTKEAVKSNRNHKPFQYLNFKSDQIDEAFASLCEGGLLHAIPHSYGNYIYTIVDKDLYFLLESLSELFTDIWSIMIEIWNYIRNPKPEERSWLIVLEGEKEANRIIIEAASHRQEIIGRIQHREKQEERIIDADMAAKIWQKEKFEMEKQIKARICDKQDDLKQELLRYNSLINKHKSLQHIFEIMFPEFLRRLKLRSSGVEN